MIYTTHLQIIYIKSKTFISSYRYIADPSKKNQLSHISLYAIAIPVEFDLSSTHIFSGSLLGCTSSRHGCHVKTCVNSALYVRTYLHVHVHMHLPAVKSHVIMSTNGVAFFKTAAVLYKPVPCSSRATGLSSFLSLHPVKLVHYR